MSGTATRTWKLLEILDQTHRFFAAKKIENPRLQAELLLADVLGVGRLDLYLRFDQTLTAGQVEAYRQRVRQRLRGAPVQYITGKAGFRHLLLSVDRAVLIPRPETEVLVEVALEQLRPFAAPGVLDLGCGSGAIALALAQEHPGARLVATDVSPAAVAVARRNARQCGLEGRVEFLCGDLFAPLRPARQFQLIASNPPYVPRPDLEDLDPQVGQYEPRLALDGGEDGLDYYRRIAAQAAGFLAVEGCLVLEAGDGQAEAVAGLLRAGGQFARVQVCPDLARVPRVIVAHPASDG